MWIVIFSFTTSHKIPLEKNYLSILVKLAQMSPYLMYVNEFSLMLRMGSNKEILEAFTDTVFQRFLSFSQI